ncbi:MAG: hypothetical protein IJH63_10425 [Methanobrevibacter sp.]|nr:hypothetical protein [Methanosphaera sp.]MBR0371115.1 hypothetical protein [Methanobrevibacter sp.]
MGRFIKVLFKDDLAFVLDKVKFSKAALEYVKGLISEMDNDTIFNLSNVDEDFIKKNSLSADETVDLLNQLCTVREENKELKKNMQDIYDYFIEWFLEDEERLEDLKELFPEEYITCHVLRTD